MGRKLDRVLAALFALAAIAGVMAGLALSSL